MGFYERYLHGHQDKVQEVWERALRIAGADKAGDLTTMREDAIDLANEALLLVLLLDGASPIRPEPTVSERG